MSTAIALFKRRTVLVGLFIGALLLSVLGGWFLAHRGASADQQARPLSSSQFLQETADIPLPGGSSRFDYQILEPQTGRLYIAHLGAGLVTVFDTKTQKVVTDIPALPGVHGVLVVPELNRVYASVTDANQIAVIDSNTLKILARIPTGSYPDGMAYDPDDKKLFVSNQFGRTNTVIDVKSEQPVATIELLGEVGNTQYDSISNRILAAVQTRNQLVAVNPKTERVLGHYDLPGCDHPHGLLLDSEHRLAFVACEDNAKLVVFSLTKMQVQATYSVGSNPDVLAFDRDWHRLYVAAESGVLSIFGLQGETLVKLEDVFVAPKAHTVAVNQQTHQIYLPLEQVGNRPVLRIMKSTLQQKS